MVWVGGGGGGGALHNIIVLFILWRVGQNNVTTYRI